MIQIKSLSKTFGTHKVLESIDLKWESGQSIALIGPNGSGKTTLLKIILGLVKAGKGTIVVQDKDISLGPGYRKEIGYMPQINRFPEQMKVKDLFTMIRHLRKDISYQQYDTELYDLFEINHMEHKLMHTLSGGMRQKVSAALAFLLNPQILILDEPTAALDPVSNEILKQKICQCRDAGKLIIITSHILHDLDEIVSHVAYLMEGKVLFFEEINKLRSKTAETQLYKVIYQIIQKPETRA